MKFATLAIAIFLSFNAFSLEPLDEKQVDSKNVEVIEYSFSLHIDGKSLEKSKVSLIKGKEASFTYYEGEENPLYRVTVIGDTIEYRGKQAGKFHHTISKYTNGNWVELGQPILAVGESQPAKISLEKFIF